MPDPNPPKRRGNPAMAKGAPSLNPGGRPRSAHALSTRIRERVDIDTLIDTAVKIAHGEYHEASDRDRLAALSWLADRGFAKPAERHELSVGQGDEDDGEDLSLLSVDQLRALRDLELAHENARATLLASPSASQHVLDVVAVDVSEHK